MKEIVISKKEGGKRREIFIHILYILVYIYSFRKFERGMWIWKRRLMITVRTLNEEKGEKNYYKKRKKGY